MSPSATNPNANECGRALIADGEFKTMNTNLFFRRLSGAFPYGYHRMSLFWPVTVGVGVGLVAGVGLGLLYAPRSGTETRHRLRERAERAGERARIAAQRVRGELESSVAEIREQSRGAMSSHAP